MSCAVGPDGDRGSDCLRVATGAILCPMMAIRPRPHFCFVTCLPILSSAFLLGSPARSFIGDNSGLQAAIPAIQAAIQKTGAEVAVAYRTLDGKVEWFSREHEAFHAASTMKIPVMIELFHQAKEGKIKLTDSLTVRNEFHSIVDGSSYKLDASEDSDAELYQLEGRMQTLEQLCELMITKSSNLATNLLIEKLGIAKIRATVHALGADEMNVLRGVEDGKAFENGLNNTTSASALLALLQAIATNTAVDAEASRHMLEILGRQAFNEGIPAGLPPGTRVAHKTGEITKIHHDAAIVYGPRPFILVILVRGLADKKDSAAIMAEIARQLYAVTK
jgi:beta-lactamase class A